MYYDIKNIIVNVYCQQNLVVIVLLVCFYVFLDDIWSESLQKNYKIVLWIDRVFNLALSVVFQWFMNQLLLRLCSISNIINDKHKYNKQRGNQPKKKLSCKHKRTCRMQYLETKNAKIQKARYCLQYFS